MINEWRNTSAGASRARGLKGLIMYENDVDHMLRLLQTDVLRFVQTQSSLFYLPTPLEITFIYHQMDFCVRTSLKLKHFQLTPMHHFHLSAVNLHPLAPLHGLSTKSHLKVACWSSRDLEIFDAEAVMEARGGTTLYSDFIKSRIDQC